MLRFRKFVRPFTAAQTKVLVVLLLVIFGLVLFFSPIVKIIGDGSQTTGQETEDAVNFSSTGK